MKKSELGVNEKKHQHPFVDRLYREVELDSSKPIRLNDNKFSISVHDVKNILKYIEKMEWYVPE